MSARSEPIAFDPHGGGSGGFDTGGDQGDGRTEGGVGGDGGDTGGGDGGGIGIPGSIVTSRRFSRPSGNSFRRPILTIRSRLRFVPVVSRSTQTSGRCSTIRWGATETAGVRASVMAASFVRPPLGRPAGV